MPVTIRSIKGYYFLDAWVMANILQLATLEYCREQLDRTIDPCGRLFDQMTMAARSVTANIAEGLSRHQTSRETEMRLTDVARASMCELLGDYHFLSMSLNIEPWPRDSEAAQALAALALDRPVYTDDWQREAWLHIMAQKKKFDPWMRHDRHAVRLNALMQLCNREIMMLEKLISSQLAAFKTEGGFAENLTGERLQHLQQTAATEGAPPCPLCGKPMVRRMAKRGRNQGQEFWSCSGYPECRGTRSIG